MTETVQDKEHIDWPSFTIEDALAEAARGNVDSIDNKSGDDNDNDNDNGIDNNWGKAKQHLAWNSTRFTLVEKQRATRFWNPDEQCVARDITPTAPQSRKKTGDHIKKTETRVYPWRRRREEVLQISTPAYRPRFEASSSDECLDGRAMSRPLSKDPHEHFAKILEPEEFVQHAALTQRNASTGDSSDKGTEIAMPMIQHENLVLRSPSSSSATSCGAESVVKQEDLENVHASAQVHEENAQSSSWSDGESHKQSRWARTSSGARMMPKQVTRNKWRAMDIHLLDGIAAHISFKPLKPSKAGHVSLKSEQVQSLPFQAIATQQSQPNFNLMDEGLVPIQWTALTPARDLVSF